MQTGEDKRRAEIEALRTEIKELGRERRRLVGLISTTHLDPYSLEAMERRLIAVRERLRNQEALLFELEAN